MISNEKKLKANVNIIDGNQILRYTLFFLINSQICVWNDIHFK